MSRLEQWVCIPEANAEYWETVGMSKKNYKYIFSHRLKVHTSPKDISHYVNINLIRRFCLFRTWYARVKNSTGPHFTVKTEHHSAYEYVRSKVTNFRLPLPSILSPSNNVTLLTHTKHYVAFPCTIFNTPFDHRLTHDLVYVYTSTFDYKLNHNM